MKLQYNGKIDVATAHRVNATKWENNKMLWSDMVLRLASPIVTAETYKEFIMASKEDQTKIKDQGGFVGGYLVGGKRSPSSVKHRQLIALDVDFAHIDFWDDFTLFYENAAVLHGTHKHHKDNPRFRLLLPLSREVTSEEYVAVARKIAGTLGIDLFDNTTFETNRLMFWSSVPKDVDYYFEYQDGPWLDPDDILNEYLDWRDTSLWPISDRSLGAIKQNTTKQKDPELKSGIVGVFCRTYTISDVIEKFLSDVYSPTKGMEGRYTYLGGSTAGGLVVYDDKFAFSHHGTDPSGGKLCNAFDLVRLHKFGDLDSEESSKTSYSEMQEFALLDTDVKLTMARERIEEAKFDFEVEENELGMEVTLGNVDWMIELEADKYGNYRSSAGNINLILANDERLKGLFKYNEFDQKRYVYGSLPWRKIVGSTTLRNVDYSGVRNYIETVYGISSAPKVEDSLTLEFERNSFHPVRDYLNSLSWDGVERIETVLTRYFGVADNVYTREALKKTLVGAVARVFNPGIKFDLMLVLVGSQGTGKSTFVKTMAGEWFSDTVTTVSGKEGLEQIQGAWLVEMAELAAMRKAEIEGIKHFISKQEDSFRAAYAKVSETYKRECVFIGTTNTKEFLRDPTGNRRFMPIGVERGVHENSVFTDLPIERDQLWAEALALYKKGEPLFLSKEADEIAEQIRDEHSESDARVGVIRKYLDRLVPKNWDEMDEFQRKVFLDDPNAEGVMLRDYISIAEIWCECLGYNRKDMDRYKTREINDIMRSLDGWVQGHLLRTCGPYGRQKYYQRSLL